MACGVAWRWALASKLDYENVGAKLDCMGPAPCNLAISSLYAGGIEVDEADLLRETRWCEKRADVSMRGISHVLSTMPSDELALGMWVEKD